MEEVLTRILRVGDTSHEEGTKNVERQENEKIKAKGLGL